MTESDGMKLESSPSKPIAELSELYKIFKQGQNEVMALKNINFKIYPGELVVIMGPSGSGKTTLLHVIAGITRPSAGNVTVNDLQVDRLKDEGIQDLLQNHIGMIFQFFNLIPTLTAAGNVEMPMIVAKMPKIERKERVQHLLEEVGMTVRANHRPFALSGGEKQRVAIAQAFANNPELILADEPTGNVDSVSAEKIMQYFKKALVDNPDKAMIIVTHDSVFRKIADRTLILRDGEIIKEYGRFRPDELSSQANGNLPDQIAEITQKHDQARALIDGQPNYPFFEEITKCPKCGSGEIFKAYDKETGLAFLHDQQIVTRMSLACLKCREITYHYAGMYNIKKDLHKPKS
jgi:putative ABC transport system ATP-binding protein